MQLKNLQVGDIILGKQTNNVGNFSTKDYKAVVIEKGKKYIYFEVNSCKIKRNISDTLPSDIIGHHTSDYFLFKDEEQYSDYILAKETKKKLTTFFSDISFVNKLTNEQIQAIAKIIGI